LTQESREWDWPVCLWPWGDMSFLRQGRLGIPRSCVYGVDVMVRRARLERVNEGVTAKGGVRRGLGEKLIAFSEIGLVGNSIFGEG
jgi:hypothetical protein